MSELKSDQIAHLSEVMLGHWETVIERNGKPKELPLRFMPELDDKIWGLKRKKLVVVGARPSNGKSIFLLQAGFDLALQGKTVFFFSFEMAKEVCFERIISCQCEIDNWLITTGKVAETCHLPNINDKICSLYNDIKKTNFIIFDAIGKNLPDLNELVTIGGIRPDVVVIDYGNMIDEIKYKSKKQSYDEYIKGLRALAIRNNFCAIMGAQINRNTTGKDGIQREPTLADLKDTGELEQVADMVFLLHWEWLYNPEHDKNKYIVNLAKNRDGRIGKHYCKIIPEYYRIEGAKNE
jgi:replicative DNA helicase